MIIMMTMLSGWLYCGGRFFRLESVRITVLVRLSIGLRGGIKIIWENRLKSMDQMNILFCLVCHVSFSRNMADDAGWKYIELLFFYLILIFEWFLCDFQVVNVALELVVLTYHRQTIPVNRGYPPHPTHTVSQSIFLYKILCKNISAVLRYHPRRHHTFYFADNWAQVSGYMNMFYVPKKPFIFYSSDHFAKVYLFSLSLKMKCDDREKKIWGRKQ